MGGDSQVGFSSVELINPSLLWSKNLALLVLWGLKNLKLFFLFGNKKIYFQISMEICLMNLSNIHKLQKSFHFIKTTLFSKSSENFCNF
jgi:hypothetical protein